MKRLRAGSYRAASVLVAASVLLVVLASGAWGQTTYTSPVKVTNTPLPVSGTVTVSPQGGLMEVHGKVAVENSVLTVKPEGGQVTVAPAGGKMTVVPAGGQMTVEPAGGKMTVVSAGGQWTVAPAGGQMTVAPAGGTMPVNGTVALSGTPQVALSTTGNTVNLAGTPYVARYETSLGDGFNAGDLLLFDNTSGGLHEVETTTVSCATPVGQKIVRTYLSIQFGSSASFAIPMTFMGTSDFWANSDTWVGSVPGKVYVPAGAKVYLYLVRHTPTTGTIPCVVGMAGRQY